MRTTIDLPDETLRQVKAHAALSGMKLNDLITRYVEQGLQQDGWGSRPVELSPRPRSAIPVFRPATGTPIPALSHTELAQIEVQEDLAKHARSFGL